MTSMTSEDTAQLSRLSRLLEETTQARSAFKKSGVVSIPLNPEASFTSTVSMEFQSKKYRKKMLRLIGKAQKDLERDIRRLTKAI